MAKLNKIPQKAEIILLNVVSELHDAFKIIRDDFHTQKSQEILAEIAKLDKESAEILKKVKELI